jgi:hypothetical protein
MNLRGQKAGACLEITSQCYWPCDCAVLNDYFQIFYLDVMVYARLRPTLSIK